MSKIRGTKALAIPESIVAGLASAGYVLMSEEGQRPAIYVHRTAHDLRVHIVTSNLVGESLVTASTTWNRKPRMMEPDMLIAECVVAAPL